MRKSKLFKKKTHKSEPTGRKTLISNTLYSRELRLFYPTYFLYLLYFVCSLCLLSSLCTLCVQDVGEPSQWSEETSIKTESAEYSTELILPEKESSESTTLLPHPPGNIVPSIPQSSSFQKRRVLKVRPCFPTRQVIKCRVFHRAHPSRKGDFRKYDPHSSPAS